MATRTPTEGSQAPAASLAAEVLVIITDALGLEEVGDPYMTLRTGAHRIGAVRVWQPPSLNRMRSNAVEKLVYLHLHTQVVAAQWIFAFSAASSLVPHFGAQTDDAHQITLSHSPPARAWAHRAEISNPPCAQSSASPARSPTRASACTAT